MKINLKSKPVKILMSIVGIILLIYAAAAIKRKAVKSEIMANLDRTDSGRIQNNADKWNFGDYQAALDDSAEWHLKNMTQYQGKWWNNFG